MCHLQRGAVAGRRDGIERQPGRRDGSERDDGPADRRRIVANDGLERKGAFTGRAGRTQRDAGAPGPDAAKLRERWAP